MSWDGYPPPNLCATCGQRVRLSDPFQAQHDIGPDGRTVGKWVRHIGCHLEKAQAA